MSRDFETVDLTSSFYQFDYNNYLVNDTIIEINDSVTLNSAERRVNNNTRNRRRGRQVNTPPTNNNRLQNNTIIEINNSDVRSPMRKATNTRKRRARPANTSTPNKVNQEQEEPSEISPKKARPALECPICWDDMLNKPLASTKCGHVFCKKCLKKSLKTMKSCPKCRQPLTGSKAYHPVYLS